MLKIGGDIIILETDKTNNLAIMNLSEYMAKTEACIIEMRCIQVENDTNIPIQKNTSALIKNRSCPSVIKCKLKTNNSSITPRLLGRLKDHNKDYALKTYRF